METLLKDIRYGFRSLAHRPVFTLVAIVVLSVGIGANTTVFSLMDAVMLRSLPISNPDQMVEIATRTTAGGLHPDFSYPLYAALRESSPEFDGMIAYVDSSFGLSAGDQTERLNGEYVSANYFQVLGVRPAIGSAFGPDDERAGAPPVAVISNALWQKRFGGSAAALQQTIALNGRTFSVIGVTPANFTGIVRGINEDVWITLPQAAELENSPDRMSSRTTSWLALVGRLKPQFTIAQAQSLLSARLPSGFEEARGPGNWDVVLSRSAGKDSYVAELAQPLTILFVAVGLILTIACANLAGLLLARAQSRSKEIGVRLALGATHWRIIRQLLTESLLLALLGGALGLLLAFWTSDLASSLRTTAGGALQLDVRLNARVLIFNLSISILTVVLFGVVPALKAARLDLVSTLKNSSPQNIRRRRGLPSAHGILVVTQVTLSLVLLVGAGLFVRSLRNLRSIDKGFQNDNVLAMALNMQLQGFDKARGQNFYAAALEKLSSLPGVQSVSMASALPVTAGGTRLERPAGVTRPAVNEPISIDIVRIAPRFLETIGLPLVRGRDFQSLDTEKSTPAMIVNETMAKKFWPGENPLGRTFSDGNTTLEVVGVARDTKYRNLRESPRMTMYRPLAQFYSSNVNLLVRTRSDPAAALPAIKDRLRSFEPAIAVFNVRTLNEHVDRALYVQRMQSFLLSIFGLLALLLTAVGIYGVIAFTVSQRTREVGIRMALGAQKRDVLKLILMRGLLLAAWGTGVGLIGCYWLGRLLSNQLYGITAYDPATVAVVSLMLLLIVLLASYIPARRATKVDPLVALRYE